MSIELRVFKAEAGVKWFKAGWLIFKTQPLTFIFMHLFIGVVGLLSLFLPFLQIIAALATPFLTAGFYQAVLTKQQGGKIMLADILKPFSAKGNRIGLLRLALYQMAAGVLMALLANGLFGEAVAIMSDPNVDPNIALQQVIESISMANLVLFLLAVSFYLTAFAYAVPLVYFNQQKRIFEVLKSSLLVFYHNMAPLSVYGAICAVFMVISAFLTFLPLLVLMPICYISFFVSYQAIFMPVVPPAENGAAEPQNNDTGRFDA
ncbi:MULTISPECIES: BPSS1780 family membrane protein [unclassified Pseudoalteromonas]|uniref:BPSS1780 family membrane protein n=1 Tax=unclassified Pseudoalteromonas TaxID=194690 RepID=UPI0025B3044D|nr:MULTISPECIES: BPSS1780 family membrane protein [unclassified Pseudoalteromonas]MDN3379287.1 BPSS1780 family membrane protein [Pseudoalteromonas sp. APC 3893]MDN3386461.1 BPSS1780 family membrane protein [Pseudoalteromonas sp. APC 4017]